MICQFTDTPCRYINCGLWDAVKEDCRFVLAVNKTLISGDDIEFEPGRHYATYLQSLTPKEIKVLNLLANGYSNSEIGKALRISHWTARNHVHSIISKLGVDSRGKAAAYALKYGLVSLE